MSKLPVSGKKQVIHYSEVLNSVDAEDFDQVFYVIPGVLQTLYNELDDLSTQAANVVDHQLFLEVSGKAKEKLKDCDRKLNSLLTKSEKEDIANFIEKFVIFEAELKSFKGNDNSSLMTTESKKRPLCGCSTDSIPLKKSPRDVRPHAE